MSYWRAKLNKTQGPRGWISPAGQFHALKPTEDHHTWMHSYMQANHPQHAAQDEYQAPHKAINTHGWISVGHAGHQVVGAHENTLKNPTHPATVALRQLVGKHWLGDFDLEQHHATGSKWGSYDSSRFHRHGILNPSIGKSESYMNKTNSYFRSKMAKNQPQQPAATPTPTPNPISQGFQQATGSAGLSNAWNNVKQAVGLGKQEPGAQPKPTPSPSPSPAPKGPNLNPQAAAAVSQSFMNATGFGMRKGADYFRSKLSKRKT